MMRWVEVCVATILTLSFFSSSSHSEIFGEKYKETSSEMFPIAGATEIIVHNPRGHVEIKSWEKDTVNVEATKVVWGRNREDVRNYAEKIQINISKEPQKVLIESVLPPREKASVPWLFWKRQKIENVQVKFAIFVPTKVDLNIANSRGEIVVKEIEGKINILNSRGSIEVWNIRGDTQIHNSRGPVVVSKVRGDVWVANSRDKIEVEDIWGSVDIKNERGTIVLKASEGVKGNYILQNHRGDIALYIPRDSAAHFDGQVHRGYIRSDLPLEVRNFDRYVLVSGNLNDDGPTVKLRAERGNIQLRWLEK